MQLTIRRVEDELHKRLKQEADNAGVGVNRFVLRLLREATGLSPSTEQTEAYTNLDNLIGTWGDEDWQASTTYLDVQRGIDPEQWT